MLSDFNILGEIASGQILLEPHPYEDSTSDRPFGTMQPASVDVRLDSLLEVHRSSSAVLDPMNPDRDNVVSYDMTDHGYYLICPGEFIIGSTVEKLTLGNQMVARLEGKSSLARLGLIPHVAAGFIDPGFSGNITLELKNLGARPIKLRPGMFIGQLAFTRLEDCCNRPYGSPLYASRYQGQTGPTLSKGISQL